MNVRPVERADAGEWLRMRHALWPEGPLSEHEREISGYFRDNPSGVTFVSVSDDGGLDGFVEVSIRSVAEGCGTDAVGYVEGWYVDPASRRRGVGRALVRAAEQWARARGCLEMASDTELENDMSRNAHVALGYAEVGRLIHFRKIL